MLAADYRMRQVAWRRRRYGRVRGPAIGGVEKAITFPATPLVSQARIALQFNLATHWSQWVWADITEFVRWEQGVAIDFGRRENSDNVDGSTCQLTVDNRDGRFSRKNALGPYYGYLKKGTPIWLAVDPGDGFHDRYFGFIVDLPKHWDRSATDSTVALGCRGLIHRMVRLQPLNSSLRRTVTATQPDYYWHFEDGTDATQFASGLPGGTALTFVRTPSPGVNDVAAGSKPFADFDGGSGYTDTDSYKNVSISLASGYIKVAFVFTATAVSGKNPGWQPIRVDLTGGTVSYVWCTVIGRWNGSSHDNLSVNWAPNAISGAYSTAIDPFDGLAHDVVCVTRQDGGNVVSEIWVDGVAGTSASGAGTLGTPYRLVGVDGVLVNWGGFGNTDNLGSTFGLGHLALYDSASTLDATALHGAATAWEGEQAHIRAGRLADEDGYTFFTEAADSTELGEQPDGNSLEVHRDAEKADLGTVYERQFGHAYKAQSEYYNQPVSMALDIAEGHLTADLEPSDNDLRFKNRWTAKRANGSEATVDIEGGITESDPIYDGKDTFNIYTDDQLDDLAGFLVYRDSLDDDYWPNVAISLAKHPSLIPAWVALPFGAHVTIDNVMSQAGVDALDLIVEGYTERWNSKQWEVVLNTSPASVYAVATYDDGVSSYGAHNTVLAEDLDTTETVVDVTATGETWITTASHPDGFPFDVAVGGLTYSCTAITGSTPSYQLTVVRLGTDKPHSAGDALTVADTGRYAR